MAQKYKHGDIFAVKLPNNKFLSARILLDLGKQCFKPKLIEDINGLNPFNGMLLVEVYSALSNTPQHIPSEILIPSFVSSADLIKNGEWKIVDHADVDPTKIDFPEFANYDHLNASALIKGEIMIHDKVKHDSLIGIKMRPRIGAPIRLIYKSLYYLNLREYEPLERGLSHEDLRFNDKRSLVYKDFGLDENESYYDWSKRLGFDLARFY